MASKSKAAGSRQFSGWVTALDKTSLTVEKRGKLAKTLVFFRHAEMKTSGDLEKDARGLHDAILRAVDAFAAGRKPSDDRTMIVIKRE